MSAHLFTPRRLLEAPGGARPAQISAGKVREAGSLLLVAAAIYVALALAGVRLDPADATVRGSEWVGPVGASLGGVLARGFGVVAWLGPLELVLIALPLFRPGRIPVTSLRLAGDL